MADILIKDILGFAGIYQASSNGEIYLNGTLLKGHFDKQGYRIYQLKTKLKSKSFKGHRLIATTFIAPIPDGMVVNHLNGIKNDNRVENLEITTIGLNQKHAYDILGRSNGSENCCKPIAIYSVKPRHNQKSDIQKERLIKVFPSVTDAADFLDTYQSVISQHIIGNTKTVKGHLAELL